MNEILKRIADMSLLDIYWSRATRAWDTFGRLSDTRMEYLCNGGLDDTVTNEELWASEATAIEFQQEYFKLYYELNSDDCTCLPDSAVACAVCQAQIKAKSIYREEL